MSLSPKHPYHLVDPSPWPFSVAMSLFFVAVGGVLAMKGVDWFLLVLSALALSSFVGAWLYDIIHESRQKNTHTPEVQQGLKLGYILFIASEAMLFFSFFWAYFNAALNPIAFTGEEFIQGTWPPKGIETLDAFTLPYLNTLILLLSGTTVTYAHYSLFQNNFKAVRLGLLGTIILGIIFLTLQILEYAHVPFKLSDGIYPNLFFIATGFHGFHVFIGVISLLVCYMRLFKEGDITPDHHVGFETSIWYWHFVDVVWIILFIAIYWWGGA